MSIVARASHVARRSSHQPPHRTSKRRLSHIAHLSKQHCSRTPFCFFSMPHFTFLRHFTLCFRKKQRVVKIGKPIFRGRDGSAPPGCQECRDGVWPDIPAMGCQAIYGLATPNGSESWSRSGLALMALIRAWPEWRLIPSASGFRDAGRQGEFPPA